MNVEEIRKHFPILEKKIHDHPLIYFDNAATTQKPWAVFRTISNYYKNFNANVHRGIHTLSHESTSIWEQSHKGVAEFLNARSHEEIIFTKNATESLNIVANTYGKQFLKEGDVVVITEMEHHSNIVPWQQIARERRLKLEWLPVLENFELDLNYLDYLIRKYKERLKILSVVHVSNVLGTINDVKTLAQKIHSIGGIICVDASQSASHMPLDVQELDCDFLVFSGHKLYAPMGTGVLYGKKEILEKLNPWMTGGSMVKKVTKTNVEWAELPEKFEAGTPNVAGAISLVEAISWLRQYSWEDVRKHEEELTQICLAGLLTMCELEILGSKTSENRVGVISFRLSNLHPHDVASLLDEKGIAIRAGFHCAEPLHTRFNFGPSIRVSFGIYNTQDEVKHFINVLKSISNKFL